MIAGTNDESENGRTQHQVSKFSKFHVHTILFFYNEKDTVNRCTLLKTPKGV